VGGSRGKERKKKEKKEKRKKEKEGKGNTVGDADIVDSSLKVGIKATIELPEGGKTSCSHPNLEVLVSGEIRDVVSGVGAVKERKK